MKFESILEAIDVGIAIATIPGLVIPGIGSGLEAAGRILKIGHEAYLSGRDRGEWTPEQVAKFDNEVLPKITAQDHWIKKG